MAFEAILSQQQARPSSRFGSLKVWVMAFTILLHAVGLAFLIVQSIWHVDELPMPAIEVTLSVAPPPPPPPPPPPKRSSSTKPKTKPIEKPKVITAPKETPKAEPEPAAEEDSEEEDEGQEGGVEGGVVGGVIGGVVGGTAPPPPKSTGPKLLSARAGHSLLAINPHVRPYKVNVPEEYVARGEEFVATISICVAPNGSVASVRVLKPSGNPAIDYQIPKVIPNWKYRQYIVGGQPTGFCYNMNYRVK